MKVIVAGSRGFTDRTLAYEMLDHLLRERMSVLTVVSGGARGADQLGEQWAKKHDIPVEVMKADWDTHGKRAGYIRNVMMAEQADALIAFWDGESRGTKHMIDIARARGLRVRIVRTDLLEGGE